MKLFLTGFMGAGKTSVGKILAESSGIPFFDQDSLLESVYGKRVSEIFESSGEEVFRIYERDLLRTFTFPEAFVFSTGGGCPCFHKNMEWINRHGTSIYLQADASLLASRLKNERAGRPLLGYIEQDDLEQEIRLKLEPREPVYLRARITIEMNAAQSPAEIAALITARLLA